MRLMIASESESEIEWNFHCGSLVTEQKCNSQFIVESPKVHYWVTTPQKKERKTQRCVVCLTTHIE